MSRFWCPGPDSYIFVDLLEPLISLLLLFIQVLTSCLEASRPRLLHLCGPPGTHHFLIAQLYKSADFLPGGLQAQIPTFL